MYGAFRLGDLQNSSAPKTPDIITSKMEENSLFLYFDQTKGIRTTIARITSERQSKVEIQIRTIAMDFWASLDHQLRYKQDVEFSEEMAAELYECAVLSAQLDNRMDALRSSVHGSKESRNA